MCDASNAAVLAELRRRKGRNDKPFALMVANLAQARRLCEVSAEEEALLVSVQRPIVLLRRNNDTVRDGAAACIAPAVAPGNPYLGLMLPYTPLHHLLVAATGNLPLVMTSGNRADEPIAHLDAAARTQLDGIADVFLMHDREIRVRCDDSVARVVNGRACVMRRSRGSAPQPLRLPVTCSEPTLAVGGQLKSTFALGATSWRSSATIWAIWNTTRPIELFNAT